MRRPLFILVLTLIGIGGFGLSARAIEGTAKRIAADATQDGGADAPGLEIRMAGETFSPGVLTIEVGQTVTFTNDDTDHHTAAGSGFNTGTLDPGDSSTVTFAEARSFRYICRFHPHMQGRIVVRHSEGDSSGGTPSATPFASPVPGTPVAIALTRARRAS